MKLFPAPILAFLASTGMLACALAPPSQQAGGGKGGNTAQSGSTRAGGSGGTGHSGGSSKSSSLAQGGDTDPAGTMAEGSSMAGGGMAGGGTISGGSVSGGSASGGTGGALASGGNGGSAASGGMTGRGGSVATGGNTGRGGFASSGGSMSRGGSMSSGGSGGSGGGGTATGGTRSSASQPAPITNGSNGFTTRYWDCCKASCGWSANANGKPTKTCGKDGVSTVGNDTQSACSGGSGFMCYWGAPWSVSDTLSYGFAAHNGVPCGSCYQLQFTGKGHYGNNAGSQSLNGKTMIVQVINIGGIDSSQFDLLIPGGGVGANNACTSGASQWGSIDIGATSGGILTSCGDKNCVTQKCQAAFGNKPDLLAGCTWFTGWFNIADNPEVVFQKINCPAEIIAKSGIGN